jgi:hypothetical protein
MRNRRGGDPAIEVIGQKNSARRSTPRQPHAKHFLEAGIGRQVGFALAWLMGLIKLAHLCNQPVLEVGRENHPYADGV